MKASLQLGRVMGIPIKVHISFLLILPLFALSFGFVSSTVLGFRLSYGDLALGDEAKFLLGLLAAVLFFVAVLLHELAHSYVAIRYGYRISGITLFLFGGVSEIENQPAEAPGEGRMAFVGPATSFLVGAAFLPFWYLFSSMNGLEAEIIAITTGLMAFYNILLGAFNLIPAFPMDGGRVLRAGLAKRWGFVRATSIAVQVGKTIALFMGFVGIVLFNPWLVLIALFIYMGAGEEERGTLIAQALEGLKVKDVMTAQVSTVAPHTTVREIVDKMMVEKHLGYPVVDGERLLGIVTLQDVQKVPTLQQSQTQAGQIMTADVVTVSPDTPAVEAIQMVARHGIGRLVVMDHDKMVGIISRSDLMKVLELRTSEMGGRRGKE